jgi:hypothetical protein
LFFVEMARAGSAISRPFNFLRLWFNSRIPPRHGGSPGAIPGSRTILTEKLSDKPGTSDAAESPKLCLLGAAPRRLAKGVVADK